MKRSFSQNKSVHAERNRKIANDIKNKLVYSKQQAQKIDNEEYNKHLKIYKKILDTENILNQLKNQRKNNSVFFNSQASSPTHIQISRDCDIISPSFHTKNIKSIQRATKSIDIFSRKARSKNPKEIERPKHEIGKNESNLETENSQSMKKSIQRTEISQSNKIAEEQNPEFSDKAAEEFSSGLGNIGIQNLSKIKEDSKHTEQQISSNHSLTRQSVDKNTNPVIVDQRLKLLPKQRSPIRSPNSIKRRNRGLYARKLSDSKSKRHKQYYYEVVRKYHSPVLDSKKNIEIKILEEARQENSRKHKHFNRHLLSNLK